MQYKKGVRRWLQQASGYLLSAVILLPCYPVSPTLMALMAATDVTPKHNRAAIVYAYDAKAPRFSDRDAQYITHINWSFALIVDGRVSGSHWRNINTLQAYKRKHPHIKTMLAIGGWEADGFSQASATAEGRQAFVESAVDLMDTYGFDGIDIDWEYPGIKTAGIAASPDDRQNFTLLLQDLRGALRRADQQDGRKRQLSIAVGASGECVRNIDCTAVAQYVDYVNVMTYDMHGGGKTTAHHANLYATSENPGNSAHDALIAYERAGIPRKKLVIGAASYGYLWKGITATEGNGLGEVASGRPSVASYKALSNGSISADGFVRYWDDQACAPYLFDGERLITYEDATSVRGKAAYARERGLAGIMCWEYTLDDTGTLLKAMDQGLRGVQ